MCDDPTRLIEPLCRLVLEMGRLKHMYAETGFAMMNGEYKTYETEYGKARRELQEMLTLTPLPSSPPTSPPCTEPSAPQP